MKHSAIFRSGIREWLTLMFAVGLASLGATGGALAETLRVPGDFNTIQAAIDAATAGDTVLVAAGQYQAALKFKSGIELRGEVKGEVVIVLGAKDGSALRLRNCTSGTISNFVFKHTGGGAIPAGDRNRPAVVTVKSSSVEISDCTITGGGGDGIEIVGEGRTIIRNCIARNNFWDGIFVTGAGSDVLLEGNECLDNGDDGIDILDAGQATLVRNVARGNGTNGFYLSGSGTVARLVGNESLENGETGIKGTAGAWLTAEDNLAEGNGQHGILIEDEGSSATLISNRISTNKRNGILVSKGAYSEIVENTVTGNLWTGIVVSMAGSAAILRGNRCSDSKYDGIQFSYGASGTARENVCEENGRHGIRLAVFGTTATLVGNQCRQNAHDGISIDSEAFGEVTGNNCSENGRHGISVLQRGSRGELGENELHDNGESNLERNDEGVAKYYVREDEIGWLFESRRFARLEAIAARLREGETRYPSTEWQLKFFYDHLAQGTLVIPLRNREKLLQVFEAWGQEYPQSVTRLTAHANAYINHAWLDRGGGWGSSVTPDGWKGFRNNLGLARAKVEEGKLLAERDPHLYETALTIGMGLGDSVSDMDAALALGLAIEPNYYPLFYKRAYTLMPRWGGRPGQLEAFADWSAVQTGKSEGEGLYARVAANMARTVGEASFVSDFTFDFNRIENGFSDIEKQYGEANWMLNNRCWLAALSKDRNTARKLFERLGEDWMSSVWSDRANFLKWKTWAEGVGEYPEYRSVKENAPPHVARTSPGFSPMSALSILLGKPLVPILVILGLGGIIIVIVIALIVALSRAR